MKIGYLNAQVYYITAHTVPKPTTLNGYTPKNKVVSYHIVLRLKQATDK